VKIFLQASRSISDPPGPPKSAGNLKFREQLHGVKYTQLLTRNPNLRSKKLEILNPDPEIEEIAPASGREIAPGAEGMAADVNIPCMAWGSVDTGLREVLGKAFGCAEVSGSSQAGKFFG